MSVGVKCMDEDYDFVWRAGKEPYFQKPDGVRIKLTVRDYVPYVPSKIKKAMPCKSRSRPIIDAGIRAEASSSTESSPFTSSSSTTPLALPAEVAKGSDDAGGDDDGSRRKEEEASRKAEPPSAADRKVEPPTDDSNPSDDALDDQVPGPLVAERGRGEALLKREAQSIAHLMTHVPKNEFCYFGISDIFFFLSWLTFTACYYGDCCCCCCCCRYSFARSRCWFGFHF